MTCGIYAIINKENGKMYIGQSVNIERRWYAHVKGYHADKSYIDRSIRKHGRECFEFKILHECSKNELDLEERRFISLYNTYHNGYNLTPGGDFISSTLPEVAKKISLSLKGHKTSEETKRKISRANKGRKMSKYTKKRLKEANMGRTPWNKGKKCPQLQGENHPRYNKPLSEEIKLKIGQSTNTTGFYRVSKQKNRCKQGFSYRYTYPIESGGNSKRRKIMSVDIEKLEKKVIEKGLEWIVLDEKQALRTIEESRIINTKNNKQHSTGVFRVIKHFDKTLKQGFDWRYQDFRGGNVTYISSVTPADLKEKVLSKGLEWIVVDKEKAKMNGLL